MDRPTLDRISIDQLTQFDQIIDVRSPSEFALDHVPGAISCPVLNDEERALVGTMYKQESPFQAKKLGAALVARNIASHLQQSFLDKPKSWRPLVYCWRGGKRSGAMTHILREIGWDARQLDGGYKAYRRHIVAQTPELSQGLRLRVICGLTGSGKSRLLQSLQQVGEQVLDLEALAVHKGSVLGNDPDTAQPSQKMFESQLWQNLHSLDRARVVYVESESKKIGNLRVPEELIQAMWGSECVWLEAAARHRVTLLREEYAHFEANPLCLIDKLHFLRSLHGGEVIERWCDLARAGDFDTLVLQLLERHYDPAYTRSIRQHYARLDEALRREIDGCEQVQFERVALSLKESA